LEQLRRRYSSKSNPRTPGKVLETNNVTLPAEYLQFNIASGSHLQRLALTFLKNRHITPEDISRYRIGYCEHGMYSDKIIIPNYNDSAQLDYWIGRSYNPNTEFKFSAPSNEKNVIGFELLISWQFPIVLCEGALDAIAIRRNAIPLYGKTISRKLKERIINERPPKIYIALDRDAYREMLAICEYFISNGLNVYAVELDGKDPSEIGYDRFWKLATDAIPITARSIFEMKLKMIL
jgi:DNA primase